jgi:hypothetical protein
LELFCALLALIAVFLSPTYALTISRLVMIREPSTPCSTVNATGTIYIDNNNANRTYDFPSVGAPYGTVYVDLLLDSCTLLLCSAGAVCNADDVVVVQRRKLSGPSNRTLEYSTIRHNHRLRYCSASLRQLRIQGLC